MNVATSSPVDLAAGRSTDLTFTALRFAKGRHTIVVIVDPDVHVREFDETDNQRQTQYTR